jgi:hypothetical protein
MSKFYYTFFTALLLFSTAAFAQQMQKPSATTIAELPQWAQLMYSENPNVYQVSQAYQDYYRTHTFEKNYHTQYYKRWMRQNQYFTDELGFIMRMPSISKNKTPSKPAIGVL